MINILSHELLNRDIKLTEKDFKNNLNIISSEIKGSSVLIIGAAGSIGSAVVKKIVDFHPKNLYLIDNNENGLVDLIRFIRSSDKEIKTEIKILSSSVDSEIFKLYLDTHKPFDTILNFAARKHVRTEEDVFSSLLLFKTNLLDTHELLNFIQENNISKKYFAVSTDKAADPFNLMGATKRLMEACIFQSEIDSYSTRFANVAFSKGSLLASFPKRIENNQPIPVPNKIKRFLITEEEAAEICLISCFCTPKNSVLIPKTGILEEIELKTVLENYLHTLNLKPLYFDNKDDAINYFSSSSQSKDLYPVVLTDPNTTGEKVSEKFLASDEEVEAVFENFDIILSKKRFEPDIEKFSSELHEIFNKDLTKEKLVNLSLKFLPTMSHVETNLSLNNQI